MGPAVHPNSPESSRENKTSGTDRWVSRLNRGFRRCPRMNPLPASFRLQTSSARVSRRKYDETQEADSTGASKLAILRRARGSSARLLGTHAWATRRCFPSCHGSIHCDLHSRFACGLPLISSWLHSWCDVTQRFAAGKLYLIGGIATPGESRAQAGEELITVDTANWVCTRNFTTGAGPAFTDSHAAVIAGTLSQSKCSDLVGT